MSNLEKFFNKKLADHSIEPSVDAWSKIEAGLTKKNKTVVWFRAAAVIALAGLATTLWLVNKTTTQDTLATTQKESNVKADQNEDGAQQKAEQHSEEMEKAPQNKLQSVPLVASNKKLKSEKQNTKPTSNSLIENEHDRIAQNNIVEIPELQEVDATIVDQSASIRKQAIVIEYTLPQIQPDMEPELKEAVAMEIPDEDIFEDKKTGLKKVLEFASEVRSSENPLGGIRQAKNDILALNFIKDKDGRNNR